MQAFTAASSGLGGKYLNECTLYVTLEPCVMCAGAMVHARLKRLVYGAEDPKAGGVVSRYKVGQDGLLNHRFEIRSGVKAVEAAELLKAFFRERRRATPGKLPGK